ncbi:hypothetical protein KC345_g7249 [Hortaea werneckii]|nr:hypothetical protein KC345_g7249 [Hortaea werneckii]
MSARDQVLAINELLEAVLLQLPMENLFVAQQVCKHWCLLITNSDSIQKALFMRPSTTVADSAFDAIRCTFTQSDGTKIEVAINPNLCQEGTSSDLLRPGRRTSSSSHSSHSSSSSNPSNLSNTSSSSDPSSSATSTSPSPIPCPQPRYFTFHDSAIYSRNRDWLHPDTMYVTQPPKVEWWWENHLIEMKEVGFEVL